MITTILILATIVAFVALFVESVRGFGSTTADVLTVPVVTRGMNHDQRRRAWFSLPKATRRRWLMAKPLNYRLHNQVLLTITALLVLGLTGLFIFKTGIAGVSLAMAVPIGGNMNNLTKERKAKVSKWIDSFLTKWVDPKDKNDRIISHARNNNDLDRFQNMVTGEITVEIPKPKPEGETEFYNHKLVPSKQSDEDGKPVEFYLPTIELNGIAKFAYLKGFRPNRIKVDPDSPAESIAKFIENINNSRNRRGLPNVTALLPKKLIETPQVVQKWNNKEKSFDTLGYHNGIFLVGEGNLWTQAITKNRMLAKGTFWFVSCEAERKAYKKWAQMLCDWSIDNNKSIVDKVAAKKIAALMIKKADFITDMDAIKGPFFEGSKPRWRDIIEHDPKLNEYLGFKTLAHISDRRYNMFPLPEDALMHFYGRESIFLGSAICMKRGLIEKVAKGYWSARRDTLPKDLQKMLIKRMEHLLVNGIENRIDAIAEMVGTDDVFNYIRWNTLCPASEKEYKPLETMSIPAVIDMVYEYEFNKMVHTLTLNWFMGEVKTSVMQYVMYNMKYDGDGVYSGNLYLRDVMNDSNDPAMSPQWITRNVWNQDAQDAMKVKASNVHATLTDRIALAKEASAGNEMDEDFVPAWSRVALNYGNTYQMIPAAIKVLNKMKEWDGVKGPIIPAILCDGNDNIVVDIDSDMVYLRRNMRGVYDFQSCITSGDPNVARKEIKNGYIYRVPSMKVRAMARSIDYILDASDDCDGDVEKAILSRQVINEKPYFMQVIECGGNNVEKPDKSLKPQMPIRGENESSVEYGRKVLRLHLQRLCNCAEGKRSVAAWDTLLTAATNLQFNHDLTQDEIEKSIANRLQGAVDVKVQAPYGFFNTMNVDEALAEMDFEKKVVAEMYGVEDHEAIVGKLMGMGAMISKIVGGHKVPNKSFLNDELKEIRANIFKKHGLEEGKVIFDNLYGVYALVEGGNSLNQVSTWRNELAHEIVGNLIGGMRMNYSVSGSKTLCSPLVKKEFFGWDWYKEFKENTDDSDLHRTLLGFIQYFPQGVVDAIRDLGEENRTFSILAMRDAVSFIAELIVKRTGMDLDRVRYLLAWGLFVVSSARDNAGFRYLPIALFKDQVLKLSEMLDSRFSLFVSGDVASEYVDVDYMFDADGMLDVEY